MEDGATITVPAHDPAHPNHTDWLAGLMKIAQIIQEISAIAPAVVAITRSNAPAASTGEHA